MFLTINFKNKYIYPTKQAAEDRGRKRFIFCRFLFDVTSSCLKPYIFQKTIKYTFEFRKRISESDASLQTQSLTAKNKYDLRENLQSTHCPVW